MAKSHYHLQNIRALLTDGFTDRQLRRLCYDVPDFRPVYEQLADNTGKDVIVDRLLEHAERTRQMGKLLALAQEQNPARYEEHQPYWNTEPSSVPPVINSEPQKLEGTETIKEDIPPKIYTQKDLDAIINDWISRAVYASDKLLEISATIDKMSSRESRLRNIILDLMKNPSKEKSSQIMALLNSECQQCKDNWCDIQGRIEVDIVRWQKFIEKKCTNEQCAFYTEELREARNNRGKNGHPPG